MGEELLFVITRRVDDEIQDQYWKLCCTSIRTFWPTSRIVIVDNGSPFKTEHPCKLFPNCELIESRLTGSRFWSAFHYLLLRNDYEKAFVIHDGTIFHEKVDVSSISDVKYVWHFSNHNCDNAYVFRHFAETLNHTNELKETYSKQEWVGSMGAMCVITRKALEHLETTYGLSRLSDMLGGNHYAQEYERLFGVLCHREFPSIRESPSLFGDCFGEKSVYALSFKEYTENTEKYKKYAVLKVYGRRMG